MKKILTLLSVVTAIAGSIFAQPLPDSTVSRLNYGIQGFKDRYHSPSIVVVIVHGNDLIYAGSFGYTDIKKQTPATIDSRYSIQSVTKLFTATMLMQLKQRNKLLLEDDIKKYLPEYKGSSTLPGKSGITLLQLATHTAGLPRNSGADITFTRQVDQWLLGNQPVTKLEPATKEEFLRSLYYVQKEYPDYELLS